MEFWRDKLGGARFVLAPMVEASELPWRLLARRHGAELCYTPMWHSSVFVRDARYRAEALASCPEDRPLIVQFCANESSVLSEAARLAQDHCDAVDLNLGCPQAIARRGHYGAFLMDDWQLLRDMVRTASHSVSVPITCKIRVFPDMRRTVDYARMLEAAGASLLTVHGRTRCQRGPLTGVASWEHIAAVRAAVHVPMFANGNIQSLADVERCLQETGVQGVMSAEGHLYNPAIFEGRSPPAWEMAEEYLALAAQYPCPNSSTRGHIFKLFHALLARPENFDVRHRIAKAPGLEQFVECTATLRERYLPYHTDRSVWTEEVKSEKKLLPWLCQPYQRMAPEEYLRHISEKNLRNLEACSQMSAEHNALLDKEGCPQKRKDGDEEDEAAPYMSKKKMKKLQRNPNGRVGRSCLEKCLLCPNPLGLKCELRLCRPCCRTKCYVEELDCTGHRIQVKTKREAARARSAKESVAAAAAEVEETPRLQTPTHPEEKEGCTNVSAAAARTEESYQTVSEVQILVQDPT